MGEAGRLHLRQEQREKEEPADTPSLCEQRGRMPRQGWTPVGTMLTLMLTCCLHLICILLPPPIATTHLLSNGWAEADDREFCFLKSRDHCCSK